MPHLRLKKNILIDFLATMAPMSYAAAAAAKTAGKDSVGTLGVVGASVSKPKTSPTHSNTKGLSPAPRKLREMRMNGKVPVVVDKTTTTYKLE